MSRRTVAAVTATAALGRRRWDGGGDGGAGDGGMAGGTGPGGVRPEPGQSAAREPGRRVRGARRAGPARSERRITCGFTPANLFESPRMVIADLWFENRLVLSQVAKLTGTGPTS
jgi:hypothetical protein